MSTKTTNYDFTKPAENEYYDVNVQNDNWDKADEALTKKVTAAGGDIADTIVSALDASTASFPAPAAKDKPRTLWGKVKKWQEDCIAKFGNYVLKSMISSQQINDSTKVPSSALAYLMQQAITQNADDISVLNTKIAERFASGVCLLEENIPTGGTKTITVTFAKGFPVTPNVCVSLLIDSESTAINKVNVYIRSRYTDRFILAIQNGSDNTIRPAVNWIALAL